MNDRSFGVQTPRLSEVLPDVRAEARSPSKSEDGSETERAACTPFVHLTQFEALEDLTLHLDVKHRRLVNVSAMSMLASPTRQPQSSTGEELERDLGCRRDTLYLDRCRSVHIVRLCVGDTYLVAAAPDPRQVLILSEFITFNKDL